jgi:hypothetical protein
MSLKSLENILAKIVKIATIKFWILWYGYEGAALLCGNDYAQ